MCRLYGFSANEETKVECTLVRAQNALMLQSQSDSMGRAHADGWGIAFYHGDYPSLERRSGAAFEDLHFGTTAERVYARSVIAHVRLATVGKPDFRNSHPFVFERWAFAHNGTVTGFDTLEAELLAETDSKLRAQRIGQTDSELLFLWLLSRIQLSGISLTDRPETHHLTEVVGKSIFELANRCTKTGDSRIPKLNVILSEGHTMVATRWDNGMYLVYREGVHDCEICGIPHIHHDRNLDYRAVVIASEPISDENWQQVPNHSIVCVTEDMQLTIQPIPGTNSAPK